jgi:hypothetical protein
MLMEIDGRIEFNLEGYDPKQADHRTLCKFLRPPPPVSL